MGNNTLLIIKEAGLSELSQERKVLNDIVKDNWGLLFEGATRLGVHIEADYYAPDRVQINGTRLHNSQGLKYADGHKYDSYRDITEAQLINTVQDIQVLIDAASEVVKCSFKIKVESL